ncbi:MAG: FecR domain-containing protein [Chitinophagaceae bacterium]
MRPIQFKSFFEKFAVGNHTESEHQQFINWLKNASIPEVETALEEYKTLIEGGYNPSKKADLNLVNDIEVALDQYQLGQGRKNKPAKIIRWKIFLRIAASLIIFIAGLAIYFSLRSSEQTALAVVLEKKVENDVLPGGNKAILTLSDGYAISLDDAKNGQLAQQGNAQIAKLGNGQIAYSEIEGKQSEVVFNTLTTPRGGQFRLTLPDGSQVWLNSASSIKYPTAFIGRQRKIEITGEAYFEIAHNPAKPFIVSVNEMTVKVLGTHFNINAYDDEASVKTTLLEGSVSLEKSDAVATLTPRQQAQIENSGKIKVIDNVDIDQVIAWKNGYFSFNRADLQTVMRQIARWYDVDISYEGKIPERQFGGKIDRNSNASEVLKILQETKVHFRIEGRKIIVTP